LKMFNWSWVGTGVWAPTTAPIKINVIAALRDLASLLQAAKDITLIS
jgi:hypothetical protein